MASDKETSVDFSLIIEAFKNFHEMVNSTDWLSMKERSQLKDCMLSAKEVEEAFEELKKSSTCEHFENILRLYMPHIREGSYLHKACDIVMEKALTAPGIPYCNVKYFIDDYLEACGVERLSSLLSSSIFQSEVYRVLLDYITSAKNKRRVGVLLKSWMLSKIWEDSHNLQREEILWEDWLEKDHSNHNMEAVMKVIADDHSALNLADYFISLIIKALSKRSGIATRFWDVILADSSVLASLEKCDRLLNGALDFLRVSGQWMEATETMAWVSRETGPCHKLGYEFLVSVLKCFLCSDIDFLHERAKAFLHQRRNDHGCTLWDDVHMDIIDFSACNNIKAI